jgi:hypothetical protein
VYICACLSSVDSLKSGALVCACEICLALCNDIEIIFRDLILLRDIILLKTK